LLTVKRTLLINCICKHNRAGLFVGHRHAG
jgi:hypothetical protein